MSNLYLIVDLLILAGPLALSFDKRVAFHTKWPAVFGSTAIIVLVYGVWDAWKTSKGVWSFSPVYTGEFRFLWLPVGEWAFFICVPYACLFILACIRAYVRDVTFSLPRSGLFAVAALLAGLGVLWRDRTYTGVVLVVAALTLLLSELLTPRSLRSRNFWLAMAVTYIPFIIANGILTALPVVTYDDTQNLGIRVGTIPIEDFLYSFAMLLLAFSMFDLFSPSAERPRSVHQH